MELNATSEIRGDYLYVKAMGEFDPGAVRVVFFQSLEQARSRNLNWVLCDITQVTGLDRGLPAVMSRFEIGEFVARSLPRGFMLALLGSPEHIEGGGSFSKNVMVNRGAVVRVTSDLRRALEWLGVRSANEEGAGVTGNSTGSI